MFEFSLCKSKKKKKHLCVDICAFCTFFRVSPSVWKMCVSEGFSKHSAGKQEGFEKIKKNP